MPVIALVGAGAEPAHGFHHVRAAVEVRAVADGLVGVGGKVQRGEAGGRDELVLPGAGRSLDSEQLAPWVRGARQAEGRREGDALPGLERAVAPALAGVEDEGFLLRTIGGDRHRGLCADFPASYRELHRYLRRTTPVICSVNAFGWLHGPQSVDSPSLAFKRQVLLHGGHAVFVLDPSKLLDLDAERGRSPRAKKSPSVQVFHDVREWEDLRENRQMTIVCGVPTGPPLPESYEETRDRFARSCANGNIRFFEVRTVGAPAEREPAERPDARATDVDEAG